MSWRDELRPASFRGVPFFVRSTSTEVGRRTVVHEVPFSDTPYPEDFGKAAGVYNITGYVIQNAGNNFNYMPNRDDLIKALEKEGAGTLVHPYYGEKQVVVTGRTRFEERTEEGGMAVFSIAFVEAGTLSLPTGTSDHKTWIEGVADDLIKAAGDAFTEVYDPSGPNFLTDAIGAAGDFSKGLQMVQASLYKVQATATSQLAAALSTVASIRTSASSIVDSPASIVEGMVNTFSAYRGLLPYVGAGDDGESGINAILTLMNYGNTNMDGTPSADGGMLDAIPETTPTRLQQKANREAMVLYFRVCGLAEAMAASVNMDFKSYDQAWGVMERLSGHADDLLEYLAQTEQDEMYEAVAAAKPQMVVALLELGAALPPVRYFQLPPDTYPSLVVAHRIYNDLDREQEVIDRNPDAMLNPAIPAGGSRLEVLSE